MGISKKQADTLLRLAFTQTRTYAQSVMARRGDDAEQLDLTAEIAQENFKAYVDSITEEEKV